MKITHAIYVLTAIFFVLTCRTAMQPIATTGRQIRPADVQGYHQAIEAQIAWFPYHDLTIKQRADGDWTVVKQDSTAKKGAMPVILIKYPESQDSVWIPMDTDNETLGKLIKHTLMTEEHITKPFASFFEISRCEKCHPEDIDRGF